MSQARKPELEPAASPPSRTIPFLHRLQVRLVFGFLLLAYIPMGAMVYYATQQAQQGYEEQVSLNLNGVANLVHNRVVDAISVADEQLAIWSRQHDALQAPGFYGKSFNVFTLLQKRFRDFLIGQRQLLPIFSTILCVAPAGDPEQRALVLFASDPQHEGKAIIPGFWTGETNPAPKPTFDWKGRGHSLAGLSASPFDPSERVLPIARAYRDNDGGQAALVGLVSWPRILRSIAEINVGNEHLEELARKNDTIVLVVGSRGESLGGTMSQPLGAAAADTLAGMIGQDGSLPHRLDLPERGRFYTGRASGQGGWHIVVLKSAKAALAPIERLRHISFAALMLALVVLMGLVLQLTGRVIAPVKKLVAATELAAQGELQPIDVSASKNEIGQLAASFNLMVSELRQLKGSLELRVAERTRSLQEANERLAESLKQLRETQDRLVQSEKLVGLGTMAAGIAHELNNSMNFIIGNMYPLRERITELCRDATEAAGPAQKDGLARAVQETEEIMDAMREGADRSHLIIESLLRFAAASNRGGPKMLQRSDILQLVEGALALSVPQYRDRVEIHKEYRLGPTPILCDPSKITQVFVNLLSNGLLAASSRPEGSLWIRVFPAGPRVAVAIEDNGTGIAEQKLKRIFEPFYTDRPVGKGTGMGLSIAYAFVAEHQGEIKVESEPNRGSTFTVELPMEGAA